MLMLGNMDGLICRTARWIRPCQSYSPPCRTTEILQKGPILQQVQRPPLHLRGLNFARKFRSPHLPRALYSTSRNPRSTNSRTIDWSAHSNQKNARDTYRCSSFLQLLIRIHLFTHLKERQSLGNRIFSPQAPKVSSRHRVDDFRPFLNSDFAVLVQDFVGCQAVLDGYEAVVQTSYVSEAACQTHSTT